jgi:ABC-type Mn2+/Zn2+ transport system ATPase subunit
VRFALALVSNPRLVVLDEPTVAMDVGPRVMGLLAAGWRGAAITKEA